MKVIWIIQTLEGVRAYKTLPALCAEFDLNPRTVRVATNKGQTYTNKQGLIISRTILEGKDNRGLAARKKSVFKNLHSERIDVSF